MLTIGVGMHKRTNMAVAIDAAGRDVARWRGANTVAEWQQLAAWTAALDPEARWGIEGARNYGRDLAQYLVEANAVGGDLQVHHGSSWWRWTSAPLSSPPSLPVVVPPSARVSATRAL